MKLVELSTAPRTAFRLRLKKFRLLPLPAMLPSTTARAKVMASAANSRFAPWLAPRAAMEPERNTDSSDTKAAVVADAAPPKTTAGTMSWETLLLRAASTAAPTPAAHTPA